MARSEQEKSEKRKGKKRKHEQPHASSTGSDDEVATKSLILEPQVAPRDKPTKRRQDASETPVLKKRSKKSALQEDTTGDRDAVATKALKRKHTTGATETVPEKRGKQEPESEGEDGDNLPTAAQLREAARPENTNAIVTVRQKKKQKHQQRLEAQRAQNSNKESELNKEYLLKWKQSREEWKFIKLRQISIQQTAFDEEKLDADLWPTALEYLASSQGAARAKISKLAEEEIEKLDKQCEKLADESERQKLIESVLYQRARDLLQSFD
ncbi:uncharacterized protein Dana_GF24867 [Drosophila ananassae]|uniref:WKF domain-containing protein n=1 Tax=Drosophila ananassae TaxID=7217 RepID=B3M6P4_DROAN|nr:uncharacterized protein C7orf50 homolog [Drosophila ananassae]EDV38694.1 uncharacterized protein Dana_GF24867 [Drosophila ananassae]